MSDATPTHEPEAIDWSTYQDAASYKPTPPAGLYTLVVPPIIEKDVTRDGYRSYLIDPLTIVGGDHDGAQVRFTRISVKKFRNANASQVGNFLRSAGLKVAPSRTDEYDAVMLSTPTRVVHAACDWEAYDKLTGQSVKGMENFPVLASGKYQSYLDIPTEELDEEGRLITRRVWANLRVLKFVPAPGPV